ncbi:hypothetical protein RJ641_023148 [Dillenia turbinata]|uniref:DUF7054 domain-containing protein n=1 Tax=Dillenia turbinata TaxID=194707 RepID=A0AAN8YUU9_9MAGN
MMGQQKQKNHNKNNNDKKSKEAKTGRFLVTITVLGSAGPIRFVVNEKDTVSKVTSTALKSYAREGRLPLLGTNVDHFFLYSVNSTSQALDPAETISSCESRNFCLCKKQMQPQMTEARSEMVSTRKGNGSWKTWLNKPFGFKIYSH